MLPRTSGPLVLFTLLWMTSAPLLCHAEPAVRYHFGDDARWADPAFDDSAWPVAQQGRWPVPPMVSDGFEWARVRVPIRTTAAPPLALRISGDPSDITYSGLADIMSYEIFVNGRPIAQRGSFPPGAEPIVSRVRAVFPLPSVHASPGTTAVVAYRVWLQPLACRPGSFRRESFEIDEIRILQLADHADHLAALLSLGPDLAINTIITTLGLGLLALGR